MNTILYLQIQRPKKDDLAGPPLAKVRLKTRSEDKDGKFYLGSLCFSYADVENIVHEIKHDLDEILKKARRTYKINLKGS